MHVYICDVYLYHSVVTYLNKNNKNPQEPTQYATEDTTNIHSIRQQAQHTIPTTQHQDMNPLQYHPTQTHIKPPPIQRK